MLELLHGIMEQCLNFGNGLLLHTRGNRLYLWRLANAMQEPAVAGRFLVVADFQQLQKNFKRVDNNFERIRSRPFTLAPQSLYAAQTGEV